MKRILRNLLISFLSLMVTTVVDSGFVVQGGWFVFSYAATLFALINTFVKPIIKLLFLPLNLITLGFFSWVVNVLALYILTLVVPQIEVTSWQFSGIQTKLLVLPSFTLSPLANFVFVSLFLSFVTRLCHWVCK